MSERKGRGGKAKATEGGKTAGETGAAAGGAMSVAAHPRASAHVRLAKGWGSLIAFALTLYASVAHGVAPDMAALRAIAAGVAGGVVARGCAVMVWRHLMVAELRARIERARAALEAADEA